MHFWVEWKRQTSKLRQIIYSYIFYYGPEVGCVHLPPPGVSSDTKRPRKWANWKQPNMLSKYEHIRSFEKQKRRTLIETRRFSILYLVSYLISFLFLWFFSQIIELPIFYSKLISDGLCFIFNFISMKFYVYANVANPILTRILLYKENKSLWFYVLMIMGFPLL